jgi:hypothetical protein
MSDTTPPPDGYNGSSAVPPYPAYGQYSEQPPYPAQPPGQPPYGPYGQPGFDPYQDPYGAVARTTNGLAIASMVVGILWIYWVGSILALIFGYIARNQIRERRQAGGGMATAGIVLGWIGVGTLVLVLGLFALGASSDSGFEQQSCPPGSSAPC